ncbi:MAG TPA: rhodanese-like domain-containing protein [Gaiellales bacterium]|jgi:rhodanese-related sulfurtransferase
MHTTCPRSQPLGPESVAAALSAGATVIDRRAGRDVHRPGRAASGAGAPLGRRRLQRSGAVDIGRVRAELATGAVLLVDVRDAWESCEGRIPGSAHLPLASLREAAHLPPGVPTVTACTDGHRAAAAASALRRFGHRNVWRLAGTGVPDLLARPLGLDLLGAA